MGAVLWATRNIAGSRVLVGRHVFRFTLLSIFRFVLSSDAVACTLRKGSGTGPHMRNLRGLYSTHDTPPSSRPVAAARAYALTRTQTHRHTHTHKDRVAIAEHKKKK